MATEQPDPLWTERLPPVAAGYTPDLRDARAAPLEMAQSVADVSRRLYSAGTPKEAIERTMAVAVAGLDGCDHAGVLLLRRGDRLATPAASSDWVLALHGLQDRLEEGPCRDAIWAERSFSVPDLEHDPRWPRFGPAAAQQGVRAMLAYRLFVEDDVLGALNLYSTRVKGFTDEDEQLGVILAAHAAVALDAARRRTQLAEAIESRQVIGEALGILKERHRLTSDQAFQRLSRASQRLNIKLHALAAHLAETGDEPGPAT